ncbi:MAG: hypothetical protein KAS63_05145 [Candidatus Heimdallarchaeota archaeon]|nr:hypothetical protein [Candidatus Heimdallarchaeota archaeon]MCK4954722.1 hypothetical protein [Candidatus Heimdallarchaeota archaeon]
MSKNHKKILLKNLFIVVMILCFFSTNSKADNFSITFWNMNMEMDDVNNYSGVRLTVFFLPTCASCISELTVLEDLDQNYNITILLLNARYETSNQTLIDFKGNHSISNDWLMGYSTDESTEKFNLSVVPSLVVLDDLGRIVAVMEGSASYGFLEIKIQDAINYRTENYNTNFTSDPNDNDLLRVLLIVVGVGITTLVFYFLINSIRKSAKEAKIANATKRIEEEN